MAYYSFMAGKFASFSYGQWYHIMLPSLALYAHPTPGSTSSSAICSGDVHATCAQLIWADSAASNCPFLCSAVDHPSNGFWTCLTNGNTATNRFKHLPQPLLHHSRQKRKHFFLQPAYPSSSRSSSPLSSQIISPLPRRRHLGTSLLTLFLGRSESILLISTGPPKNCSRRCFTSLGKTMVLLVM
ncbi:uncharacterized protein LOC119359373 [Triticum dicoccoides]|uniref:uncharacterized protein LOC119359373 n=1 Tax=Triticum dicoccoides TaxID=85692 RepID=UPI00188F23BD|nr:uncharacterized protein LOC119359373 [Triticum dicoccoides]